MTQNTIGEVPVNIRRNARVKWVAENWAKLKLDGYPWGQNIGQRGPRDQAVIIEMKKAGVMAKTTYWKDVPLKSLIEDARRLKRTLKAAARL